MGRGHKPSTLTLTRLKKAAHYRIMGWPWLRIAPKIGRKTEMSARALPYEHPEEWRQFLESERDDHLDQIESEAITGMRVLIAPLANRDDDGRCLATVDERKIAEAACHSLLTHSRQSRVARSRVSGKVDTTLNGQIKHDIRLDERGVAELQRMREHLENGKGNGDAEPR